jgi:hypothetical protein
MKHLITAIALLCNTSLFAQTIFTGANGNDWADPGNWSEGVPSFNDAIIPEGLTVAINDFAFIYYNLTNHGSIINYGSLNNFGSIINNGIIENTASSNLDNIVEFVNNGTISIGYDSDLYNSGSYTNNGSILNDGSIDNIEIWINNGDIDNNFGGYLSCTYVVLDVESQFDNYGTINNYGNMYNQDILIIMDN